VTSFCTYRILQALDLGLPRSHAFLRRQLLRCAAVNRQYVHKTLRTGLGMKHVIYIYKHLLLYLPTLHNSLSKLLNSSSGKGCWPVIGRPANVEPPVTAGPARLRPRLCFLWSAFLENSPRNHSGLLLHLPCNCFRIILV